MIDGLDLVARKIPGGMTSKCDRRSRQRIRSDGLRELRRVYADQAPPLLRSMASLHPDLPRMLIEDVYGRIVARPGLSLRERELVNVTVLTIQRLDRQLYSHVRGSLKAGIDACDLLGLLRWLRDRHSVNVRNAVRMLRRLARNPSRHRTATR